MGNRSVALNQLNVSVRIKMLTNADGIPATGITDVSAGHAISYQRGYNNAFVADGGSAADLALITSVHSDWGFFEIGEGWYRVDFPDAAFAAGEGSVLLTMKTTAESAIGTVIDIGPLKFQGTPTAVTATTTTFPAGSNPYEGDTILAIEGTGLGGEVIITSVAAQVATHAAFPVGISDSTTTVVLIPGYAQLANLDATISSRSILNDSDLTAETATILGGQVTERVTLLAGQATERGTIMTGQAAERVTLLAGQVTERGTIMTGQAAERVTLLAGQVTERTVITGRLPTSLTVGGRIRTAVEVVNGRLVTGTGKVPTGIEWGDGGVEV